MCAQLDETGPSVMVTAQRLIAMSWKFRFGALRLIVRLIRTELGLGAAPARSGLVVERYFPTSAGRSPADRSLTTLGTSVLVRLGGRGSMVNMSPPSALCVITRDP